MECWGLKPVGVGSGKYRQRQIKKPNMIALLRIFDEKEAEEWEDAGRGVWGWEMVLKIEEARIDVCAGWNNLVQGPWCTDDVGEHENGCQMPLNRPGQSDQVQGSADCILGAKSGPPLAFTSKSPHLFTYCLWLLSQDKSWEVIILHRPSGPQSLKC